MKIDVVKILFALALGVLIGYICKIIATEENQWYSLSVGSFTMAGALVAAFANYTSVTPQRSANTKVAAWIMSILIMIGNIAFSFTNYNQEAYIVVMALVLVVDLLLVYILAHKKNRGM